MGLEPIEIDRDGQKSRTDLDAVVDGTIATKALAFDLEATQHHLVIATKEFLQGVLVAAGKDPDPKSDHAITEAAAAAARAVASRDGRLARMKGDLSVESRDAKRRQLEDWVVSWEQTYGGLKANLELADVDGTGSEQIERWEVAMMDIEGAHAAALAEIKSSGALEAVVDPMVAAASERVATPAVVEPVDVEPVDVDPVVDG